MDTMITVHPLPAGTVPKEKRGGGRNPRSNPRSIVMDGTREPKNQRIRSLVGGLQGRRAGQLLSK